ncbi:hypothetical protein NMG60_11032049 [Bertholletia excelsa]
MMESSLLTLVNSKGETALLIAARHGRSETMANDEKDTALLEAVRYNHLDVLKLLLKEEPKLSDVVNESMETPLYLATEKDHHQLVEEILKTCKSPAYIGPDGKTALHAAAIRGCMTCTQSLIDYGPESPLMKKMDKYGWTPLHYAAHCEHIEIVRKLLDRDSSTAYISAVEDEHQTALHLATRKGHIEVMKSIFSHRPDCWEAANSRKQNILHMAVESQKERGIHYILKQPWSGILINQKDIDGNTPLHLLSAFGMDVSELITDSRTDKLAFNKLNLTPMDIEPRMIPAYFSIWPRKESIQKQLKKAGAEWGCRNIVRADRMRRNKWNEDHVQQLLKQTRGDARNEEDMQKYLNKYSSHVIVASLIATVAFAASLTVPGGYHGNEGPEQGMAILARKAAFKAFLITDTLAMMSSSSALFFYFFSSAAAQVNLKIFRDSYLYASYLNLMALVSMALAFVTGTAAVLQHSHALMVSICVLFAFFLLIPVCFVSKVSKSDLKAITKAPPLAYFVYWGHTPPRILLRVSKYHIDVLQKKLN